MLYASEAPLVIGAWVVTADTTAAGGASLRNPNANAAKITTALAAPANYFEMTFNAEAGRAYRLWFRGKADSNNWANDSVFAQFSNAIDGNGVPIYRIGTSAAMEVNLEESAQRRSVRLGLAGQWLRRGVLGPVIYFAMSGPQTIRIQQREDGLSIDQIVLSSSTFLNAVSGRAQERHDDSAETVATSRPRSSVVDRICVVPLRIRTLCDCSVGL